MEEENNKIPQHLNYEGTIKEIKAYRLERYLCTDSQDNVTSFRKTLVTELIIDPIGDNLPENISFLGYHLPPNIVGKKVQYIFDREERKVGGFNPKKEIRLTQILRSKNSEFPDYKYGTTVIKTL